MSSELLAEAVLGTLSNDYCSAITDIQEILGTLRDHLEMETVFISQLTESTNTIRYIASKSDTPIKLNEPSPRSETYCDKIVSGELDPITRDTSINKVAQRLAVTRLLDIGCYMGVPLKLQNGLIYGALCSFKHEKDETLRDRDLKILQVFAELASKKLSRMIELESRSKQVKERIKSVLDSSAIKMVYQPVYDLKHGMIKAFEALARFDHEIGLTPDIWFADAKEVGLGKELELLAVRNALKGLSWLPSGINISINISPEHVISGSLGRYLGGVALDRLLIEITEHEKIVDYTQFNKAFKKLRNRGARLAVDDVGAGHANFFHIIELQPDVIKLDMSLTRNIDSDFHRQALAKALIDFTHSVNALIIAEGIENERELITLKQLGVDKVQGYFIGRPTNIEEAAALCKKQ